MTVEQFAVIENYKKLTLECKLKCYVKPMKDPLRVSPSKGNQGTTRGKERILLISVGLEPTTSVLDLPLTVTLIRRLDLPLTVDLIRRSWVRFPPRSKEFTSCCFLIPFTRANAQLVFHGLHIAL